ncbi:hypothetical protein [Aureimonas phyllosphaerae]|uniref:Uncharacterized protein n=1 Tax=Aureimonas phyllosphaerae TaxID=1166078 RepID=A0A7W6BYQ7_9HYPH|nr:hypothetical protein [Aureimonas phyllosphaerae]MBB3936146.1 hypothetical protein [Aureimonas phyllosphaerae]MBB3960129.1 hypothetical protein [Aureimonas phyllosphaerae]SFF33566.1 hypothetical protein SAMN05216566_108112 [Aureimonas phyllosphaerae]
MNHPKITDGANDRPRDASIGQSAGGLPDDSGRPVMVDEAEAERMAASLEVEGEDETEAHPS